MSRVKVGLVQINSSFSGQSYFPYSVGILQAYAQRHLRAAQDYEFGLPICSRLPVAEAAERLADSDVAAFSLYVWNAEISLAIARELKRRRPGVLVVFGGPHVPDQAEGFLREHPFVDVACHGEGERVFSSLLEGVAGGAWRGAPSISYRDGSGRVLTNARAERLRDLSAVPSPYLEGVFDRLIEAHPRQQWIALWETNRGCPFSCTFCDWGSAVASKVSYWDMERLRREMDWFADHKIEFIFCADANFGLLPRDLDLARYCAEVKLRRGYPHALSVQNTKNATERSYEVQRVLSDAGLNKGVVVSLQSVDPGTLKAVKRDNISLETYFEIQRRFAARGIETMSDLILGLPGESYDSFARGVAAVIDNGQHNRIQFNNLSVLPNAEMGDPAYRRKYGMETVRINVVNVHGELEAPEVFETEELVIATASMPRPDWVRARAFAWWTGLLHFDKLLQIPLIVLRREAGAGYKELLELFSDGGFAAGGRAGEFPVLSEIRALFLEKARGIQAGGEEYCHAPDWLGIWWPADEYVFIKLCREGKLDAFYAEAEAALSAFLGTRSGLPRGLARDATALNRALLKQPFQDRDLDVGLSFNVWEFYRAAREGRPAVLERRPSLYHVDRSSQSWRSWDDWCRQVVWYGNKKGAYLYGGAPVEPEGQLAGHY